VQAQAVREMMVIKIVVVVNGTNEQAALKLKFVYRGSGVE